MSEPGFAAGDLSQLIFTDDLTGLYNRRFLFAYLRRGIAWKDPNAPPLSLALLDIDRFKEVNDACGHLEGDRLIQAVASVLRQSFRPEDVIARYGGDELCVLMLGTAPAEATVACEAFRTRIANQDFARRDGTLQRVTLSIGVASFPEDATDAEALLDHADQALYASKRAGRNRTTAASAGDEGAARRDAFVGLPCPAFVGREKQTESVKGWLSELRMRQNRSVFVRGAPGMGKSRFLREVSRWARDQGMIYVLARCEESGQSTPYRALVALIEKVLANLREADFLERLSPEGREALRDVLPAAKRLPVAPTVELSEKERRRAIFDGLVRILRDLAEREPVVLLLDNAEFADAGTVEVLRAVLRKGASRILLVAALGAEPPPGLPSGETVELDPLAPEALRAMLQAILPEAERPPEAFDRIVGAAAGNPMYVEEAVRSLLLRGRILRSERGWKIEEIRPEDLPSTLEEMIAEVYSTIHPEAGEVLTNAAVIGGRFDLQILKETMGQNEGRTQDSVDRAEAVKLVRRPDPERPDEFEFTNDRSRQTRYERTREEERRGIHRRVGDAEERLQRGDSSELAWHFERAGDRAKAEAYRRESAGRADSVFRAAEASEYRRVGRETRVPEATRALPAEGLQRAEAFLRALVGAVRMVRLYPEGSAPAESFERELRRATQELLPWTPVTFAAREEGLRINGAEAPARTAESAALLRERWIASFTLGSAASWPEVSAFCRALTERGVLRADSWDSFLERHGIRNLDVVQRVYVEEREAAERAIEPDEIPLVRDALRSLKAAADNLRLYPTGHSLVEESLREAAVLVPRAIKAVGGITLATAEGGLLLNGIPADPKVFSDAGEYFARLIDREKLGSLTLLPGIGEDEIRAWCGGGRKVGGHVVAGERTYALRIGPSSEPGPPPSEDPLDRAKSYVNGPDADLLTERFRNDFPTLLTALGEQDPAARALVQRVVRLLRQAHACRTLTAALRSVPEPVAKVLATASSGPLSDALARETDPETFSALLDAVIPCVRVLLGAAQPARALEVLKCGVVVRLAQREMPHELRSAAESLQARLLPEGVLDPARRALRDRDPIVAQTAARIAACAGPAAAAEIADALFAAESGELRRALAEVLRSLGAAGAAPLVAALEASAPAEWCRCALECLDALAEPPVDRLAGLVDHGDGAVRSEVMRLVRRIPAESSTALLARWIGHRDCGIAREAISVATERKLPGVAAEALLRLAAEEDARLLSAVCAYFAAVPNPESVLPLIRLASQGPRWWGLIPGVSEEVRVAAVRALGGQGTPEAERFLQSAISDRNAAVRAAARLASRKG